MNANLRGTAARAATALVALVALALGGAAAAAAAPPTIEVFTGEFSFVDDALCPFPLEGRLERRERRLTFADGSVQRHLQLTATLSANGRSVVDNDNFTVFIDADLRAIVGALTSINVPGYGIVLVDAGRIVFDGATGEILFVAGPHMTFSGDTAGLCSYLAGVE